MAARCRGEVTDAGRIQIPVLAITCGILVCLVAGIIIFAQLARNGIRH
jgi:hypothetical protein